MKKRWLFLIAVAIITIFTLLPLSFLNASPTGTSLVVTKDATARSEGYIAWSVEKSVDQNSFNLSIGQTATANYTVTVVPGYIETSMTVSGNIHIENVGSEVASIKYVKDVVEYKIDDGPWTVLTTKNISGSFTISPPAPAVPYIDVPYSVSFTPVADATAYRNTALVGLKNYSIPGGGVGFHEYSYATDFSVSGGTSHNAFADVSDSLKGYLGETWVGAPSSYIYTYPISIGPYLEPGDYTIDNTATVTGTEYGTTDTDSISVSIYVGPANAKTDALINSGIPGKGLETAPGQQKIFNPKSQASENAGMKK